MASFSLRECLARLLASERAQTLASYAPLGLVALLSGSVIGAAVATATGGAAAGLGAVGVGLATNLVSAMLYDVIRPESDDMARGTAIQAAMRAGEPQVGRLVAEALLAAGPQLAAALPAASRPALVEAITTGMTQAGGALAAIAPDYGAALRAPADWAALQSQLQATINRVELTIAASGRAQVRDNVREVEQPGAGPTVLRIDARDDAIVAGNRETVRRTIAGGAPPPAAGAPTADSQHQRDLLAATRARLQIRELQAAQYGIDVPPHVAVERDALRAEVARLHALAGGAGGASDG